MLFRSPIQNRKFKKKSTESLLEMHLSGSFPGSVILGWGQGTHPWDSPGKNTGVGCHFLLQCIRVKSEVAQSCLTLRHPMDCSLPGSSVHVIFQARVLEWGAIAFSKKPLSLSKCSSWTPGLSECMLLPQAISPYFCLSSIN